MEACANRLGARWERPEIASLARRRTLAFVTIIAAGTAMGACTGRSEGPDGGAPPKPPVHVDHWAYNNPTRPAVPDTSAAALKEWPRQPIDHFILAGLQQSGLSPAPEADRRTLIRRASLDVRGLPPTPAEVEAFLGDSSPDAYERLIEALLDDPAYGEHRAHAWLDVARYADTHGMQRDNYRSIWPYRDYVIAAFNDNMPFDQFTVEQLAGDLLPQPTVSQLVATGFSRCAMSTGEPGVIEDEYAAMAAKDRVETVAAAWMGLTLGCAACHDHKFDPLKQKEFYQMAAFFRNTTQPVLDMGEADQAPTVMVPPSMTPTLITRERAESPFAYVLVRGLYDRQGERVTPDVPAVLPGLPAGQRIDRLALARWLTSPDHPLMARVAANRFWAEVFGTGIVATPDNFGVTGAPPSNQALLDWLAVQFRESGWNVKALFRLLLTSATYRQSAMHNATGDQVDPDNRLLWRGPRFRMDGELIRDQALAASGLLVRTMGGPPVKPYQPAGLWEAVAMEDSNTAVYQQDTGDGLFRRSVYTFWKRAAPPPSMQIFNAPTRETTTVQRERSDTPLQALVVMNDPQYVEAARHLAVNALKRRGDDVDAAIDELGMRVLARPFDAEEHTILRGALDTHLAQFERSPEAATTMLAVGASAVDGSIPAAKQAAWMMLASAILNLDEALNK